MFISEYGIFSLNPIRLPFLLPIAVNCTRFTCSSLANSSAALHLIQQPSYIRSLYFSRFSNLLLPQSSQIPYVLLTALSTAYLAPEALIPQRATYCINVEIGSIILPTYISPCIDVLICSAAWLDAITSNTHLIGGLHRNRAINFHRCIYSIRAEGFRKDPPDLPDSTYRLRT